VKRKLHFMDTSESGTWLSRLLQRRMLLGVIAFGTHVAALRMKPTIASFWHLGPWTGFAIVCLIATWAPSVPKLLRLSPQHAWTLAAAGCSGLLFHWYFLVSPVISTGGGFFLTVSGLCALGSTYLAPGSRYPRGGTSVTTRTDDDRKTIGV
jgi:hypothetical protein